MHWRRVEREKRHISVIPVCNTILHCCTACIEIFFNGDFLFQIAAASQQRKCTVYASDISRNCRKVFVLLVNCNHRVLLSINLKKTKSSNSWLASVFTIFVVVVKLGGKSPLASSLYAH